MKKKIICFLISMTLLSSIAGCGNMKEVKDSQTSSKGEDETTITQDNSSETETARDGEDNSENSVEEIESQFLNVEATNVDLTSSDDKNGRYGIVNVKYTKIALGESDAKKYPKLATALDDKYFSMDAAKGEELADLTDKYLEWEMYEDGEEYISYESSDLGRVLRADHQVLSLIRNNYSYQGGVHGDYMVYGEAYDVESGQELSLFDVVVDEAAFTKQIKEKLLAGYENSTFLIDLDTYFEEEHEFNWTIDYSGITVYFEPYEIAAYASGILKVRFSFEEDGDLINEKYMLVPDDYVTPVTTWTETYADLDFDGSEEAILLVGRVPDEDWGFYDWEWSIDDKAISDTVNAYENESYLVKRDGKFYAYMFNRIENDYETLSVIDIASEKELGGEYGFSNYGLYEKDYDYDEVGTYWRTICAFTNPDSFMLESRMEVLGTYSGVKEYHVSKDGKPESNDTFYDVNRMGYLIKAVRDLPCTLIDKDGNVLEENAILPKGTMLRIVRTDGEKIADLQDGNYSVKSAEYEMDDYSNWYTTEPRDLNRGTFYRIEYEIKDYEKLLDGESIFDVFQGMMFAG